MQRQRQRVRRGTRPEPEAGTSLFISRSAGTDVPDLSEERARDVSATIQRTAADPGQGRPLDPRTQEVLESRMGHSFESVRVHTDTEADGLARTVNAVAFTTGSHIFFRENAYSPASPDGLRLLAHEAAHVAQQAAGPVTGRTGPAGLTVSEPGDTFERAADAQAARAVAPSPFEPAATEGGPAGNRASDEAGASAAGAVLQRQQDPNAAAATATPAVAGPGTTPATSGAAPAAAAPTGDGLLSRELLEGIRSRATARYLKVAAYTAAAERLTTAIQTRMIKELGEYDKAYQGYANAVRAGRLEAQNQTEWLDIFVGIGIGVGVGVLAEAALPATATTAMEMAFEVGAEVVEAGAGAGVKAAGWTRFAGADMEPSARLDARTRRLSIYEPMIKLYADMARASKSNWTQFLLNGGAEYAIGEVRVMQAGGATDMTRDQIVDLVGSLVRLDQTSTPLDKALPETVARLETVYSQLQAEPEYAAKDMEQDIWIMWMSTLSNSDSNVLDLDEIEDHLHAIGVLGHGSRLGVDFGVYTSEDDELEALGAARAKAPTIKARYEQLTMGVQRAAG